MSGFDERRAADFFSALGVPVARSLAIPDASGSLPPLPKLAGRWC